MAKSRTQINADSDAKRNVKVKGVKLHLDTIALLKQLSDDLGLPENQIVTEALNLFSEQQKTASK